MGTDSSGDVLRDQLTFTWEPLDYLMLHGLADMTYRQWEEARTDKENLPYDPDWDAYRAMEADGSFRVLAARYGGHLIGYTGVRVFNSIHSRNVVCGYIQDAYVEPSFRRRSSVGIKLFRVLNDYMKIMKVQRVSIHTPVVTHMERGGLGKLLKFLGYKEEATVWYKRV